jgi:HSP20 family molecular chaperone IbpA
MDYDHNERAGLLPEGCTDLLDAIKQKVKGHFMIWVRLPEVRNKDIEFTVKGRRLTVVAKPSGGQVPFETMIDVPAGYSANEARAFYIKDRLLIAVPQCEAV